MLLAISVPLLLNPINNIAYSQYGLFLLIINQFFNLLNLKVLNEKGI